MARRGPKPRADGRVSVSISLGSVAGRRQRKWFYGATFGEADRQRRAWLREHGDGAVLGDRQTLASFLDRWLVDVVRPTARVRSYERYAELVRLHVVPAVGSVELSKLRPQHVQQLYAGKLQTLSPATVGLIHVVVRSALKVALRWGLVGRNVASLVDPPKVERREPTPFSERELAALVQAVAGHRFEALWTLLLATGLRFGEAAALRWSDLDLDARTLTVAHTLTRPRGGPWELAAPKTAKSRRVLPLPGQTVEMLRRQRVYVREARLFGGPRWQEHELVFPTSSGLPQREAHVLAAFHRALEGAGLPPRRLHDLRATYATGLSALGWHPRVVQDLLGHSRIETTMGYTASVSSVLRDAADAWGALLGAMDERRREAGAGL